MATWQERVKQVIGPKGYDAAMRRSFQTVLMVEAQRCVKDRLGSMRPFQRKIAHHNQMLALLDTLSFIPAGLRKEVLWRTGSSKEVMNAEVAWKRSRSTEKELAKIGEKVKPLVEDKGMSHTHACDTIIQEQYENALLKEPRESDAGSKERSGLWEYSHNHLMMAFRLYYKGDKLDPDFPSPVPPVPIVVPQEKPKVDISSDEQALFVVPPGAIPQGKSKAQPQSSSNKAHSSSERQQILAEVREHLELLKEFEGVISEEDLNRRKRELFMALPPAPPPANAKRPKMDGE